MNIVLKCCCRGYQLAFRLAMPVLPYREPERFDSIHALPPLLERLKIRSILLVTDRPLREAGATRPLEELLERSGIRCAIYDGTRANPTVHNVEEARERYLGSGCQGIIAFGGGSSMDCAKAAGARIVYPRRSVNQMKGLLRVLRRLPPLIAIPTTAGTGSEVTVTAVITDSDKKHKYTMNNFTMIPHYTVLDPAVTRTLSPALTATTGMDALTHAVEAYIGNSTTRETRRLALDAVRLIFENIESAYQNGDDLTARKNMLHAAHIAGIAFSKSYVGYVHAVAHSLGGEYNTPHGLANAVLLPIGLELYGPCVYRKLWELGRSAGVVKETDTEVGGAAAFIAAIRALNQRLGIPEKLPEIRREDVPHMAAHAAREANPLYPVPKLMDRAELERFYELAADWRQEPLNIHEIVETQRRFFNTGATLPVSFRVEMLRKLRDAVDRYEGEIGKALAADLGKSGYESFMCEIGLVRSEISYMIRHTHRLASDHTVRTPLAQFAAHSFQKRSPYGNTLIMSPWNYPVLLTLDPLADAIAAGNTAVVKPSAYAPATSALLAKLIGECFPAEYVAVVTGGRQENAALLDEKFDFVFFTGSQAVGKEVLRRTAERLTPAVLELGGKSPCIVDETAKIPLAARRIVFGKYLNCGQTCVAPDYILCHSSIKDKLVDALCREVRRQYGENPLENPDYGKIINEKHFQRLLGLIDPDKVVIGGQSDEAALQIAPTILDGVTGSDPVMQEEIFGPVLPVLTYDRFEDLYQLLADKPKPLALYLFSQDRARIRQAMSRFRFGGGCVNDVVIHLATSEMGFGGVGESGMGAYHGRIGFEAFSHTKSIVDKKTWMDLPMRYQPYQKGLYGKLLHLFLR